MKPLVEEEQVRPYVYICNLVMSNFKSQIIKRGTHLYYKTQEPQI